MTLKLVLRCPFQDQGRMEISHVVKGTIHKGQGRQLCTMAGTRVGSVVIIRFNRPLFTLRAKAIPRLITLTPQLRTISFQVAH